MSVPTSVWSGTFHIFGVDVRCHVLSDGRRIIDGDSLVELFEAMAAPNNRETGDLADFVAWKNG